MVKRLLAFTLLFPSVSALAQFQSQITPEGTEASPSDLKARESAMPPSNPEGGSNATPLIERVPVSSKPADVNRGIFYRNKLEFSLDGGWLPINIPFPLDVFVGDAYNTYPLKYTLVPIIASLRWHIDGISGPSVLRGNFDLTLSSSVTAIPRGPESRYLAYIMGIRRNFARVAGEPRPTLMYASASEH